MLKNSYESGNKLFTFIVISTIFSIILNWILSDYNQLVIYFVLVLLFGIIHGANDIYLIIRGKSKNKKISKTTFIYVIIVLLITLIFFSFPLLSLMFFVLFSCYHFGEQQWTILDENIDLGLLFFNYGLLIFSTLFYFHRNEVVEIVFMISGFNLIDDFFKWLLIISITLSVLVGTLTFTGSFIAFGKLQGLVTTKPVTFPGQQLLNAALAIVMFSAAYMLSLIHI